MEKKDEILDMDYCKSCIECAKLKKENDILDRQIEKLKCELERNKYTDDMIKSVLCLDSQMIKFSKDIIYSA